MSFRVESLNYPASGITSYPTYAESVAKGTSTLRAEIESIAATCPHTNILLAGYSEGAHVVGNVLASDATVQLSAAARSRVSSVTLMADPSYVHGQPYDDARNGPANGVFARAPGVLDSWQRVSWDSGSPVDTPIVHSWCWAGDRWCQGGTGPSANNIHASYGDAATQSEAYQFMRAWLISRD